MTVTLSSSGYDPDFFGHDLGRGLGSMATDFTTAASQVGAITSVDYAYKCGQGKTIYRCYGIGAYSHALLVDLQHQVNRVVGKKLLAEDGILGPSTLAAVQGLQKAQQVQVPNLKPIGSLDELAAHAPVIVAELKGRADQLRGGETLTEMGQRLLDSMQSVTQATADEVAQDKATGAVPAGFQQTSVRMTDGAVQKIANSLGPGFAKAAQAAQLIGAAAGGPEQKRSTMIYVAVGVGATALALGAILIIALSGNGKKERRARR